MKKKKRLSRLIEMVLLIQSRPDWRPSALAEHFGISQTRIHQDIRVLVSAGIPIYFEGDGYKIARGPALESISISPEEALQLFYPDHLFRNDGGPAPEAVLRAKLLAALPADVRQKLSAPASRTRVQVRSAT
ncbi:MAG: helix-turn-helix transcriptional regulator, partial [Planctomycetota bacterium]